MISIKPGKSFREIQKRLKDFPKIRQDKRISGATLSMIQGIKWEITRGIRAGGFLKPELKPDTIRTKAAKGNKNPALPLLGEQGSGSMLDGLVVDQLKNGWRLSVKGQHHSGKPQKMLWAIHEFGATIPITEKARKAFIRWLAAQGLLDKSHPKGSKKSVIKIPARQPLRRGFNAFLRSRAREEAEVEIRKAIRNRIVPLKGGK